MQMTIYNTSKHRLETEDVKFTEKNTTWFDDSAGPDSIYKITDFKAGLLIADCNYSYPVLIDDVSRSDINHDREKAKDLKRKHLRA